MITSTDPRPHVRNPLASSRSVPSRCRPSELEPAAAPVVVAVDDSPGADDATRTAVRLARDLAAPLVFVYVRQGPSSALGEPYYQRRLDAEMRKARRALDRALALAAKARVPATDEELAGDAARRVVEFAEGRRAQLVVVGSRRRRLGRSVSRSVIRSSDRPVVVAGCTAPAAA
jgi:nucleotide-binding universal stress UspA family protein